MLYSHTKYNTHMYTQYNALTPTSPESPLAQKEMNSKRKRKFKTL